VKIILHIGNYKTGTSALQNFLYKNRQKLLDYGIYYGNTWNIVNNHAGLAFAILKEALERYGLLYLCDDLNGLSEDPGVIATKIRFMAEARKAGTIIISYEGLFADLLQVSAGLSSDLNKKDIENVNNYICQRLKELFPEAEAACYLRRQDLYIESMYMEYCKVPWRTWELPVDFEEFNQKQNLCLDYYKELSRWKRYFGDKVHFRIYERERLLCNDILYDFLYYYTGLGTAVTNGFDKINIAERNISLSRDALEHKLLNKVNEPLSNYLYKVYSEENPDIEKYFFMQYKQRYMLLDRYKKSNSLLFNDNTLSKLSYGNSFNYNITGAEYPGLAPGKYEKISQWIKNIQEI